MPRSPFHGPWAGPHARYLPSLTPRQQGQLAGALEQQQRRERWDGELPVLLLNRCWLRLESVPVERLAQRLPPDATAAAPELERFRHWRRAGLGVLAAEARCWEEFGPHACRAALRRHWEARERGHHGWTLETYLDLLGQYRVRIEASGPKPLPLIVLARGGGDRGDHELHWLVASGGIDAAHLPPD